MRTYYIEESDHFLPLKNNVFFIVIYFLFVESLDILAKKQFYE